MAGEKEQIRNEHCSIISLTNIMAMMNCCLITTQKRQEFASILSMNCMFSGCLVLLMCCACDVLVVGFSVTQQPFQHIKMAACLGDIQWCVRAFETISGNPPHTHTHCIISSSRMYISCIFGSVCVGLIYSFNFSAYF